MKLSSTYGPYRLEVKGELHVGTAMHIGSGERLGVLTDDPIVRVANLPQGDPFIRASSLRGVLRSRLEREQTQIGVPIKCYGNVFGAANENEALLGRLRFFDSLPMSPGISQIRDHVRHSAETGAAAYGAKFDREVVLPTSYGFRVIYYGESKEDEELELVRAMVELLKKKAIRVGAKRGLDHGRLELRNESWISFQRSDPGELARYCACRLPRVPKPTPVVAEAPGKGPSHVPIAQPDSLLEPESFLRVELGLHFKGPVLVKAAFAKPPANPPAESCDFGTLGRTLSDAVFVERDDTGKPYLPEESIRGVLRSQAFWIVESMLVKNHPFAQELKSACGVLFGSVKSGQKEGQAGLLEIGSGTLTTPVRYCFLDHVAIDRIVGSAVEQKKFDTCALDSPVFNVHAAITLQKNQLSHIKLFLFLLRDLMEGHLRIGYGTTRGFGTIARVEINGIGLDLANDLEYAPDLLSPKQKNWYARRIFEFNDGWTRLKHIADHLRAQVKSAPEASVER